VHTRIGTDKLDNTHDENRGSGIESSLLPLGDDPDALSRSVVETDLRGISQGAAGVLERKDADGGAGEGG